MVSNHLGEQVMTLSLTDLYCGGGGSSTGAIARPGVSVRVASNHWKLAIDTHNANHPDTEHICADLSQIDPRLFPNTDLLWASPSCTKHSVAQGKKRQDAQPDLFGEVLPDEAAERSRATMWDVVRFSEYHQYRAVVVENVVEVYQWPPFQSWLLAMRSLGYVEQIVYLNLMHAQLYGAGAAQSRDRIYIVFTRAKDKQPNLSRVVSPAAVCPECGPVRALQAWKRNDRAPWGKYRTQYVYRCPNFTCKNMIVEPAYRPAAEVIDWSLLGQRIGDRTRPLADKTMARINAGIERYWGPLLVPVEGREGKTAAPVDKPARTMTARNETGLLVPCGGTWREEAATLTDPMSTRTTRETDGVAFAPFIAELRGGNSDARAVDQALATVTASGNHHALVTAYYGKGGSRPTDEALSTVTSVEHHALLMRNNMSDQGRAAAAGVRKPIDINDVRFRMLEPREIIAAMDFPADYVMLGNRRETVRLAGNAVTPCAARDLVGIIADTLHAA